MCDQYCTNAFVSNIIEYAVANGLFQSINTAQSPLFHMLNSISIYSTELSPIKAILLINETHISSAYKQNSAKQAYGQASKALLLIYVFNSDIVILGIKEILQLGTDISFGNMHALVKQFFIASLINYTDHFLSNS